MAAPADATGLDEACEFIHRTWPAHPRQLASLRAELRRWLVPLTLTRDTKDDVVLAVNEAASNSIEHAYPTATDQDTVDVTFWTEPHALCLEIVDHGVWRTPSGEPTGRGRGIEMMQRLVAFVLIRHDTRGTRVFLRHPLPGDPLSALHSAPVTDGAGPAHSRIASPLTLSCARSVQEAAGHRSPTVLVAAAPRKPDADATTAGHQET